MFEIILVLSSPQNKSLYFPCQFEKHGSDPAAEVCMWTLPLAAAWSWTLRAQPALRAAGEQDWDRAGIHHPIPRNLHCKQWLSCQSNPALGQLKAKARNTTGFKAILVPWKVYKHHRVILLQSALKGFVLVRWHQCPFSAQVPASGSQGSPNHPYLHQNNSPSRGSYSLGKACLALLLLSHLAGRIFSQAEFPS